MSAEFTSWQDYRKFAEAVRAGRRHIFDDATRRFIDAVGESAKSRISTFPQGTRLSRAQIAHEIRERWDCDSEGEEHLIEELAIPCPEQRIRPYADRAKEGRVNPKGHPVFYAATDDETAIAESRPWKGAHITLGCFNTLSSLDFVDCTRHAGAKDRKSFITYAFNEFQRKDQKLREEGVWVSIEDALKKPITPSDEIADYVPTQILAEIFMERGYDGLIFQSSIGPGKNVVIFDQKKVQLSKSRIAFVDDVKVTFTIGNDEGIRMT